MPNHESHHPDHDIGHHGHGPGHHGHGHDGREEYHILPEQVHGHLYCSGCGKTWEIRPETGAVIVEALASQLGFAVDLSHVTISGRCAGCHD